MAAVSFKFTGLEELKAELRKLPADLAAEGASIVEAHGNSAAAHVRSEYNKHRVTGNLADHVVHEHRRDGLSAVSRVKSTARHAFIFENGTKTRHYITVRGKTHLTGAMPGFHVFIPAVMRARRAMYTQLADLLTRHGLTVSGDA